MRIKFPAIIRVIAGMLAAAAFVIPAHMVSPASVSADPGIMRWDTVITPGYMENKWDIDNLHGLGANTGQGSEIIDMAAGNDGKTVAAIVRMWVPEITGQIASPAGAYKNIILMSFNGGITFSDSLYHTQFHNPLTAPNFFQVAIATDNPKVIVLTSEDRSGTHSGPKMVWETGWVTGYAPWSTIFNGAGLVAGETIRCIDVSTKYGGYRDIAFGTEGPTGGRWATRSTRSYSSTQVQLNANGTPAVAFGTAANSGIDYEAIKFSPTYNGDASVALVYADANATYYNVALRDLNQNTTLSYAFGTTGVEVRNPASAPGSSPDWSQLNRTVLELPSDFSGQSSSLRRAYVSLDAAGSKSPTSQDGIYRIDDSTTYVLMDTSATPDKSIYSIAYYGTYASGKLLAGERRGQSCTATVPTWFTDSPTTCPIPCWYPALKPTTGAGNQGTCNTGSKDGVGAAVVHWNGDGSLGLVATGSLPDTVYAGQPGFAHGGIEGVGAIAVTSSAGKGLWYQMQGGNGLSFVPAVAGAIGFDAVNNDESAFAISRNNGETWNQLAIIDTTIDWFNDVAVAPDCSTIYLASANENTTVGCNEFDSVWRSTLNPNVAAPLPVIPPLGTYWERVLCRTTSGNCSVPQSELPILRVVESCKDKPDGEIVAWAAQNAHATSTTTNGVTTANLNSGGVMAWSPDFGDFWASITPRYAVQDFTFETSTVMYVVSSDGVVQRLPYTGTSWSTNLPNYDTSLLFAHTIAAVPDGNVLVGGAVNSPYPAAYSLDKGVTLNVTADPIPGHGNEHVIFDVDYANNQFIYMGDDANSGIGTVYRNTIPSLGRWVDGDMMSPANGNGYVFSDEPDLWWIQTPAQSAANNPPHIIGQYGLVQAFTGDPQPALYSAHDMLGNADMANSNGQNDSAVCRTLVPRNGMPKPGIQWSCLDVFAPLSQKGVSFTLEPTSLKACGCCSLDTNTTLYAIDDESGGRWNGHHWSPSGADPDVFDKLGYTPVANQGMLWAFTDCLAKKGPVLKSPADQFLVGADPVTGRNSQIDLAWEQLCLSVWYQLQIAKDKDFTLRINPMINWGNGSQGQISAVTGSLLLKMDSTNNTSPAAWIPPGALPEAGAIYYWRIRSAKSATMQIADSPWSEVRSFTVKAGFIVNTPYYGVQLLSPNNSAAGIVTKPTQFSWSPWQDATKYEFDLAKDSEFKQMVTTANTTTTAYQYPNALDYNAVYFWRVKALEVNGQNIPSDWSATFSFTTEKVPVIPPPPVQAPIPAWVWVLMAIGSILAVAALFLIMRTRRI
jgi:hypothetical protein